MKRRKVVLLFFFLLFIIGNSCSAQSLFGFKEIGTSEQGQEMDGAVYRGDNQKTGHFDSSGPKNKPDVLWKFGGCGLFHQPTILHGTIYFGCYNNFYALEANTGNEIWRISVDTEGSIPPVASDGIVYFGSGIGFDNTFFYAFDAESGDELWRSEVIGSTIDSSAIFRDKVIYCSDIGAYALDGKSGEILWRFSDKDRFFRSAIALSNNTLTFTSNDMFTEILHALDIETGEEIWKFEAEDLSSPAIANEKVYVGDNNGVVFAFDIKSGEAIWNQKAGSYFSSPPSIYKEKVYVALEDGYISQLDSNTGEVLNKFDTSGEISYISISDNVLYFGSDDKYLYAVDTITGENLWSFETPEEIWSSPLLYEGKIFFNSVYNLFALVENDS